MFLPSFSGFCKERLSLNLLASCPAPCFHFPLESEGDSTRKKTGLVHLSPLFFLLPPGIRRPEK